MQLQFSVAGTLALHLVRPVIGMISVYSEQSAAYMHESGGVCDHSMCNPSPQIIHTCPL